MSEKVGTTANGIPTPVTTKAVIDSHNLLLRTQDICLTIHSDNSSIKVNMNMVEGYIPTDSSMRSLHILPAVFITSYVHSTGGNMYAGYFPGPLNTGHRPEILRCTDELCRTN